MIGDRDPPGWTGAALVGLVAFMFLTRMRSGIAAARPDGVLWFGNDAWYHWRTTLWTAHNWPWTMGHDPLTGFPDGADPGQFGTPFDLLAATVALVAGLGDPSAATAQWAVASVPPLIAALAVLPVYSIARTAFGRRAALASAAALALLPGVFFTRGLFGFLDHHVAEVLLQATAVALLAVAVRRPGDRLLPASIACGLVMALYVVVWPPGFYFFGVMAAAATACSLYVFAYGDDGLWIPVLTSVKLASGTSLVVLALVAEPAVTGPTTIGLLHVAAPLAAMAGCAALKEHLRRWDAAGRSTVVGSAVGLLASALASAAFLATDTGASVFSSARSTMLLGDAGSPIAEAAGVPLGRAPLHLMSEYGLVVLLAAAGAAMLDRRRPDHWFVGLWAAVSLSMALTQVRFNYYLAPALAVLAGPAVVRGVSWLLESADPERPEAARWTLVALVVAVAAAPATGSVAVQYEPSQDSRDWGPALDWMADETPDPGVERHGRYESGSADYGVMAWWDYGHWITTRAGRAPVSNPFQQNADIAAEYLLSDDADSAGEGVRYVAVDHRTASDKFPAVAEWTGEGHAPYFEDDGSPTPAYHRTTIAVLYFHDGIGEDRHRLVYETRERSTVAVIDGDGRDHMRPVSDEELMDARADPDADVRGAWSESSVKVYERVPGALITGEAEGDRATAVVTVRTNTGRSFVWSASSEVEDGRFEIRVPYATDEMEHAATYTEGPYEVFVDGEPVGEVEVSEEDARSGGEAGVPA